MWRALRTGVFLLLLAMGAGAVVALYDSSDPVYRLQELLFYKRFHRFDPLIEAVAERHGLDPMLVKAVVWRESRFHHGEVGAAGERGLMQVMEGAAQDWANAEKIETFDPADLFDPKTNLEVGSWYLSRARDRWKDKDDWMPFALSEYNAGRTRVNRWIDDTNLGPRATADDLRENISFPGTKDYVRTILDRYEYYKEQGRL